jgi:hypothetical protein
LLSDMIRLIACVVDGRSSWGILLGVRDWRGCGMERIRGRWLCTGSFKVIKKRLKRERESSDEGRKVKVVVLHFGNIECGVPP